MVANPDFRNRVLDLAIQVDFCAEDESQPSILAVTFYNYFTIFIQLFNIFTKIIVLDWLCLKCKKYSELVNLPWYKADMGIITVNHSESEYKCIRINVVHCWFTVNIAI